MLFQSAMSDKDDADGTTSFTPEIRCTTNEDDDSSSLCCVFTTNLRKELDLPEVLAVDVQPAARVHVQQCLEYVAHAMKNSNRVVPDMYRLTLQLEGRGHNDYAYFSCLHVTNPAQLEVLYKQYMGRCHDDDDDDDAMSFTNGGGEGDMVILLMPQFLPRANDSGSSSSSLLWGNLPRAPDNKARMRDHIKARLEDQVASPCGFVRYLDGNARNKDPTNVTRVTLHDALAHVQEWKIDWNSIAGLKKRDLQYLVQHAEHFADMFVDDGGDVAPNNKERAIAAVCDNGSRWTELYQEGKWIVPAAAAK